MLDTPRDSFRSSVDSRPRLDPRKNSSGAYNRHRRESTLKVFRHLAGSMLDTPGSSPSYKSVDSRPRKSFYLDTVGVRRRFKSPRNSILSNLKSPRRSMRSNFKSPRRSMRGNFLSPRMSLMSRGHRRDSTMKAFR